MGIKTSTVLATDSAYREAVGAENVMKWEAIHPEPGRYDWPTADRLVDGLPTGAPDTLRLAGS